MGPGQDGEFREVRENVRKYVKGPIQWIKTTKEVPSPIKSTPVRIDSSTESSAKPPTSQQNIPQPISLNAPGPSSKASRPPKKPSTSVRLAERKVHQRGVFSKSDFFVGSRTWCVRVLFLFFFFFAFFEKKKKFGPRGSGPPRSEPPAAPSRSALSQKRAEARKTKLRVLASALARARLFRMRSKK